jgi:hypothetical protein
MVYNYTSSDMITMIKQKVGFFSFFVTDGFLCYKNYVCRWCYVRAFMVGWKGRELRAGKDAIISSMLQGTRR